MGGGFAQGATLPDVVREGLLYENVFTALDRGHGCGEVGVVRCGNTNGVDVVTHLVEHHAKVLEPRDFWKFFVVISSPVVIDITERYQVFFGGCSRCVASHARDSDHGDVEFAVC